MCLCRHAHLVHSQSSVMLYSVDTLLMAMSFSHPLAAHCSFLKMASWLHVCRSLVLQHRSFPLWIQYLSLCPQGAVPGMWGPQCGGWSFLPVSREARGQCDLPSPSLNVLWKTPAGSSLLIQARAFRAAPCASLLLPAEHQPC